MKEKNLPDDKTSQSLEELTKDLYETIEKLEKEKNLENSLDNYQKLIRLNNMIEKNFQKKSKQISQLTKEKITKIISKRNEKKN
ncbi:exonuclease VII small subunit [Candidatus Pelagibacter sp.]|jgi:exonuclease VII small subunit|nr:exonuclease VII small subunit [Candidatus Pelagibacter sp.]